MAICKMKRGRAGDGRVNRGERQPLLDLLTSIPTP
jgi:hypothetical protein